MRWEGKTMRSVTSFFNKTIFRNDYRCYWPIMFAYTLFWMALPISQWNRSGTFMGAAFGSSVSPEMEGVAYEFLPMALVMAVIFGCLMAMAVFSYLMNSRAVGLMHSLPVRRRSLFASHVAAALSMFVIGNLLVVLVTVLVQLGAGAEAMHTLLMWLLVSTVLDFIFFSIAVLCCLLTGCLLAVPVLYLGVNTVAAAVTGLVQSLGGLFYFGYDGGDFPALSLWLTPAGKIMPLLLEPWYLDADGPTRKPVMSGAGMEAPRCLHPETAKTLAIYALVAVVLLVVSYLLYRRRASEAAGDPVAVGWAKPIFRYGLALLGGLALGLGVYAMVIVNMPTSQEVHLPTLLVCMIMMGMLCYFTVSMVIEKSFKVFGKGWIKAALVALVLVVLCFVMRMDLTGYEQRIPDQEDVKNVSLQLYEQNAGITQSSDAKEIQLTRELHQTLLDIHKQDADALDGGSAVSIQYKLKNGGEVRRLYFVDMGVINQKVAQKLEYLTNSETVRRARITGYSYPLSVEGFLGGQISDFRTGWDRVLTAEEAQRIYRAMEKDLANGAGYCKLNENLKDPGWSVAIQMDRNDGSGVYQEYLPRDCMDTVKVLEDLGIANLHWEGA